MPAPVSRSKKNPVANVANVAKSQKAPKSKSKVVVARVSPKASTTRSKASESIGESQVAQLEKLETAVTEVAEDLGASVKQVHTDIFKVVYGGYKVIRDFVVKALLDEKLLKYTLILLSSLFVALLSFTGSRDNDDVVVKSSEVYKVLGGDKDYDFKDKLRQFKELLAEMHEKRLWYKSNKDVIDVLHILNFHIDKTTSPLIRQPWYELPVNRVQTPLIEYFQNNDTFKNPNAYAIFNYDLNNVKQLQFKNLESGPIRSEKSWLAIIVASMTLGAAAFSKDRKKYFTALIYSAIIAMLFYIALCAHYDPSFTAESKTKVATLPKNVRDTVNNIINPIISKITDMFKQITSQKVSLINTDGDNPIPPEEVNSNGNSDDPTSVNAETKKAEDPPITSATEAPEEKLKKEEEVQTGGGSASSETLLFVRKNYIPILVSIFLVLAGLEVKYPKILDKGGKLTAASLLKK